jgi:hypothetical protein
MLVHAHGGELALTSTVGFGTRARVRLPLDQASTFEPRPLRVGGGCAPPPPVVAPLASSLRTPSRGDPPLKLLP